MPRTLLVEGWTGLPHSYAIVNQYQCLAMMDRPDLRLLYRERPFPSLLTRGEGLFSADQRARMAGLPAPGPGDVPGAVLRLAAPFDFSPPPAGRLFVFGTLEWGALSAALMHGGASLAKIVDALNLLGVTPSDLVAILEALKQAGALRAEMVVI